MDIQNLNQTPPPKMHKILWLVIGVLLLVVAVGAYFWWQEVKKTNGINGSIEEYIQDNYTNKNIQLAALQYSEAVKIQVEQSDDPVASNDGIKKGILAINCIYKVTDGDNNLARKVISDVREYYLRSAKDVESYFRSQDNFNTTVFYDLEEEKRTPCNFETPGSSKDLISETLDWKTYTNTEYGFEFKYPPNLFTEDENKVFWIKSSKLNLYDGGGVAPEGVEGKDWIRGYEIFVSKEVFNDISSGQGYDLIKLDNNNIEAFLISGDVPSSGPDVYIKHPTITNSYVRIGYHNSLEDEVQVEKIFDQILSTFKFLTDNIIPSRPVNPTPDRIAYIDGIPYIKDEIVVILDINTVNPTDRIKSIASQTEGKIIGSVPETLSYQLQYKNKSYDELRGIASVIEKLENVESANLNSLPGPAGN